MKGYKTKHLVVEGRNIDAALEQFRGWRLIHVVPNMVDPGNYHLFFEKETER